MTNEPSVAPRVRVNLVYRPSMETISEHVELPLRVLVVGDFSQRPDPRPLAERRPFAVDKDTFAQRVAERALTLDLAVPDRLSPAEGAERAVALRFSSLRDFTPEGVARQIPAARELLDLRSALNAIKGPLGPVPSFKKKITALLTNADGRQRLAGEVGTTLRQGAPDAAGGPLLVELLGDAHIRPEQEGFDTCRRGLAAFLDAMMSPRFAGEPVSKNVADARIAELDAALSAQVDAVLHHPAFQRMEAAWRSLKFLVDRVDFRENVRVDVLDCSKDDLAADFEDAPDTPSSGLHAVLRAALREDFDGRPYGLVVADFAFGPSARDAWLLSRCASAAELSLAPFVAAASPAMVGVTSWAARPEGAALATALDGPDRAAWRAFRASEPARFVGLCLPRFLLRLPYGQCTVPVKAFHYEEGVGERDARLLWGSAAFAFAARAAAAFARDRWCPNVVGPADGAVEDLPLYEYESGGEVRSRRPAEARFTERDVHSLADAGLIALANRDDGAPFFPSARSCHDPSAPDDAADPGRRLLAQLPYLFLVTRVAHYLNVVHAAKRPPWPAAADVASRLGDWLRQYVAPLDDPTPAILARRPFREASVEVEAVREPAPGYRFRLSVRPHFRHEGRAFTLTLAGRLDP